MSSLQNCKGCFLCLLGIVIFFLQSHWAWCLLVLTCTILMCVGPDACSPNVCCPDLYWSSNALSWRRTHSIFLLRSTALSQREGGIHHSQAQLPLGPSVLSAFCCSAAACTVSIPSRIPWSRIPVSSTEWSKWYNWVFCFWKTWGIKLEDNSGSKGYWEVKQKKG